MPTPTDRFELAGCTFADKFQIANVVAEGGFGVVYAATHLSLGVPVAVKVLKVPGHLSPAAKQEFFQSFVNEAKTIARIKHTNIVQVLDTGISTIRGEPAPWMALEWLDGHTLAQEQKARGRMPRTPNEVLDMLRPVLDALALAHDEGVAHRDLTPGNLMIVRTKRGTIVKLLDFGVAKVMAEGEEAGEGQTRTQSAVAAYSPRYAAPEQISRTRTGPWTDVHAMGLILTELLIGGPAFVSTDMTDLLREALADPRPTPAKFGVNVGAWEPVLQRAVAYRPDARFQNAGQLLAALDTALPYALSAPVGVASPGAAMPYPISTPSYSGIISGSQPNAAAHSTSQLASISLRSEPVAPRSRAGAILGGIALASIAAAVVVVVTQRAWRPSAHRGAAQVVSSAHTHTPAPVAAPPVTPPQPIAPAASPPPAPVVQAAVNSAPVNPPPAQQAVEPASTETAPSEPADHGATAGNTTPDQAANEPASSSTRHGPDGHEHESHHGHGAHGASSSHDHANGTTRSQGSNGSSGHGASNDLW